jgi:chemotaxis family two-component system response regulator Rcp1
MENNKNVRPIDILLIEDNPGDIRLTREALKEGKVINNLYTITDGIEAINFLKKQDIYKNAITPDLILLDLNLPKKDGREVLKEIKEDNKLKLIPVVILTTSKEEQDIIKSYNMYANCYITKPVELESFIKVIKSIEDFWLTIVKLPTCNGNSKYKEQ